MDLTKADFELFQREYFAFKQLKARYTPEQVAAIKEEYQQQWQKWKALQLQVAAALPTEFEMSKPKIESWTNGWNLRNHFWSAYRSESRLGENACLATLLNRKQYQVYLMFQHYQSEKRQGTPEAYNQLLVLLPQWSQSVDLEDYYIWPQKADELADHLSLSAYLADEALQQTFKESLQGGTFQIGKLFFKETAALERETVQAVQELRPLYQALMD